MNQKRLEIQELIKSMEKFGCQCEPLINPLCCPIHHKARRLLELLGEETIQDKLAGQIVRQFTAERGLQHSRYEAYAHILESLDYFWQEVKQNPYPMIGDCEKTLWERRQKDALLQLAARALQAIVGLNLCGR